MRISFRVADRIASLLARRSRSRLSRCRLDRLSHLLLLYHPIFFLRNIIQISCLKRSHGCRKNLQHYEKAIAWTYRYDT
jgi:hypothetical protein